MPKLAVHLNAGGVGKVLIDEKPMEQFISGLIIISRPGKLTEVTMLVYPDQVDILLEDINGKVQKVTYDDDDDVTTVDDVVRSYRGILPQRS